MKKYLLTGALSFMAIASSYAQYYYVPWANAGTNPGGINIDDEYPSGGGLPAGWATIHSGNAASPAWSPATNIPFAFSFNGSPVTQFKVSTSGVLTFDVASAVAAPSYTKAALPNAAIPDNSVCIWGLSGIGSNDFIVTKTFGTAPNRQFWIQFSSYGYGTAASDGSNFTYWSIVLEETTNRIHIVDNRSGGYTGSSNVSAGLQINSTTAVSVAGSPSLATTSNGDPSPADNTYYTFIQGMQPAYDLTVTDISTPQYLGPGNNNITGSIKNLGSTTITSLTLNYKIGTGATVTGNLNGLNITPGGTYTFTHPTPWNATAGTYTVDVWADGLNGSNNDANPADDHKTKSITVVSQLIPRVPLFEVFTSSTCPPCEPGNKNFHGIVDTKPAADYVAIKYQEDFPGSGDPYCTDESFNRRGFYGITSIPRMEIDGGWDGNANAFTEALYTSSHATPAFVEMNGTYSVSNQTVNAKIKFKPIVNVTGMKVHVAIIENKTTQNIKNNGETEFFQVMKKMLPDENGTAKSTAMNAWDSVSFNYTFNGNYRLPANGQTANRINHATEHSVEEFNDLRVIAWVQDGTKQVLQALNLTSTTSVGDLTSSIKAITVYPNPASETVKANIQLKNADELFTTIVDISGKVVYSQTNKLQAGETELSFPVGNLANGNYHIMIFDKSGNSSIHQIAVQH